MYKSKKPSEAEFRKRKKEREEKTNKNPKIDNYFKNIDTTSAVSNQEKVYKEISSTSVTQSISEVSKIDEISSCGTSEIIGDNEDESVHSKIAADQNVCSVNVSNDIGHYPIGSVPDSDTIMHVLSCEPCQPCGPFPKDPLTNRSFCADYYYVKAKTEQKLHRFWLCYSKIRGGVYCEPCWLFSNRQERYFQESWCKGTINDWQGLSKKVKEHESSQIHLNACFVYCSRKKHNNLEPLFEQQTLRWKEILKRILDVIVTLSVCNLPLRGHRENIKHVDSQSGNFLNIIDLLSRYDPLLRSYIDNQTNKTKYLSPLIQNELISLASNNVLNEIIFAVQESPFYSLILDTTQDISKVDQLSLMIRYVSVKQNENISIHESFLGFIAVRNQTSESLRHEVVEHFKHLGIPLTKCRGQGYDGAAVMSGKYNGLQAKIKELSPTAEYVHCAAHNLNLVLNDSVNNIRDVSAFYELINMIYVFFSESLPRWQKLRDEEIENAKQTDNCMVSKTLKRLCPTRWSSRYDSLIAVKHNFPLVMRCLSKLSVVAKKQNEADEARMLLKKMNSLDFVLHLVLQCKILENVNLVSKVLQSPQTTLEEARNLLKTVKDNVESFRNSFSLFRSECETIARSWCIDTTFQTNRSRKIKKFYDELAEDFVFDDAISKFRMTVFNTVIDTMSSQIKVRFEGLQKVVEIFSFLQPKEMIERTDEELIASANAFCNKYEADISNSISTQLIMFKNLAFHDLKKLNITTIAGVAKFLLVDNSSLASSLPDLCTSLLLFLTLPVTSASAERSFSKLKIIKSYLRSTMSQTRLSDLAVLSIESEWSKKINLDKVVQDFVNCRKRRGLLQL